MGRMRRGREGGRVAPGSGPQEQVDPVTIAKGTAERPPTRLSLGPESARTPRSRGEGA